MRVAVVLSLVTLAAAGGGASQQPRLTESPAAPLYRQGTQLLAAEKWREAADTFERAIDLDEQYPLAFYGLGRARIGERQYTAAIAALERARALYIERGGRRVSREMSEAQRRQEQLAEIKAYLAEVQRGGGANAMLVEQLQDQIQNLELATRQGVTDLTLQVPAFVSLSLGSAHFRRGSMMDAEREYRNALRANPKLAEAHNNLAVVYLMTHRPAEAEKSLEEAERRGFKVSPQLRQDIRNALRR